MPTPTQNPIAGLIKVISSRSVQVAMMALVASLMVAFGAPEEQKKHVETVLAGIFLLAGAIIGSWGYQDGKLNEGTVPAGREPVAPPAETTPPKPVEAAAATPTVITLDAAQFQQLGNAVLAALDKRAIAREAARNESRPPQ